MSRPRHHPQTASRIYSGEAVIITPAENMVRMLNPTGSRIWELADGTRTVAEIAAVLAAEYAIDPAQAEAAARRLLDELTEKGLVAWAEA